MRIPEQMRVRFDQTHPWPELGYFEAGGRRLAVVKNEDLVTEALAKLPAELADKVRRGEEVLVPKAEHWKDLGLSNASAPPVDRQATPRYLVFGWSGPDEGDETAQLGGIKDLQGGFPTLDGVKWLLEADPTPPEKLQIVDTHQLEKPLLLSRQQYSGVYEKEPSSGATPELEEFFARAFRHAPDVGMG